VTVTERNRLGWAWSSLRPLLDEETLPQNSDAVLVLSQWQAALRQYRGRHYGYDSYEHRWFTVENPRGKGH
jgi:hypothetical protein